MNAIGAVTLSRSTRSDTSANAKTITAKIASSTSNIGVVHRRSSRALTLPISVYLIKLALVSADQDGANLISKRAALRCDNLAL